MGVLSEDLDGLVMRRRFHDCLARLGVGELLYSFCPSRGHPLRGGFGQTARLGYLWPQLRLSCPWKPHTLHAPALGGTTHDRLSWPSRPHQEQVRVPFELIALLRAFATLDSRRATLSGPAFRRLIFAEDAEFEGPNGSRRSRDGKHQSWGEVERVGRVRACC
jgi:hypothetical protein